MLLFGVGVLSMGPRGLGPWQGGDSARARAPEQAPLG